MKTTLIICGALLFSFSIMAQDKKQQPAVKPVNTKTVPENKNIKAEDPGSSMDPLPTRPRSASQKKSQAGSKSNDASMDPLLKPGKQPKDDKPVTEKPKK